MAVTPHNMKRMNPLMLLEYRFHLGLTIHDMASKFGLSSATYNNLELGNALITRKHIAAFEQSFEMYVGDYTMMPVKTKLLELQRRYDLLLVKAEAQRQLLKKFTI